MENQQESKKLDLESIAHLLRHQGLVTQEQLKDILAKGKTQETRLFTLSQAGASRRVHPGAETISPAEVIASLNLEIFGKPGKLLTEDAITEAVAGAVQMPYLKIDPLKLNLDVVTAHIPRPFALRHLIEHKKLSGSVVKTVSTTRMVDLLARKYDLPLFETPIGFKHICELMLTEDILMGGEESGGLGVKGHIPERDGILLGLLLLEAVAVSGKGLRRLLDETMDEIGHFSYRRIDRRIEAAAKEQLIARLNAGPPAEIDGRRVTATNFSDGFKFIFENGDWLLIRPSGTEPVLRLYSEAGTPEQVDRLLRAAEVLAAV